MTASDVSGDQPFDPAKIDLVGRGADGTVLLYIVQARPWSGSASEFASLQQKVNTYVSFALDGQLVATYPDTAGRPWSIVIDSQVDLPPAETATGIELISAAVRSYGGVLAVHDSRGP
jgi:uncharacterized protein DUF6572